MIPKPFKPIGLADFMAELEGFCKAKHVFFHVFARGTWYSEVNSRYVIDLPTRFALRASYDRG